MQMSQIIISFQNSTPIQQLIFKDLLEDIYASLFNRSNQTEWIQVIEAANQILPIYNLILSHEKTVDENGYFEGMPNPFTELKEGKSEDLLTLKKQIEMSAKNIYVFPIWKTKTSFLNNDTGKNIIEAYGNLFSESLDEINKYRQVWIQALIFNKYMELIRFGDFFHDAFWFINLDDIPDGRDKFFLDRFSNETLAIQTNEYQREFLASWEVIDASIQKVESEALLFRCNPQKIHELYEEIHGRNEKYNTIQFFENGNLTFRKETISFRKSKYMFHVLRTIFILWKNDFKSIFSEYNGFYDDDRYYEDKHADKIEDAIHGINKRLKDKFPTEKQFFGCEEGSVVIKILKK